MSQFRFRRCMLAASVLVAAVIAISVNPALADPPLPNRRENEDDGEDRPSEKAVLSEKTVVRADVAYGKDEKQRLDVYAPRDAKDAPDRRLLPSRRVEQGRQERGGLQAEVPERQRRRFRQRQLPLVAGRETSGAHQRRGLGGSLGLRPCRRVRRFPQARSW